MLIAKIIDNAVATVADYRAMYPGVVFPASGPTDDWLMQNSCMRVSVNKPHDTQTQTIEPTVPYIEGDWVYTITVRDKTAEELAADKAALASQMRARRNQLLAQCDWTQLADSPVDKAAWSAYRQQLRDVTSQAGFPDSIAWPAQPE